MSETEQEQNEIGQTPLKVHCPQCWALVDLGAERCSACQHLINLQHYTAPAIPVPHTIAKLKSYTPPQTMTTVREASGNTKFMRKINFTEILTQLRHIQCLSVPLVGAVLLLVLYCIPWFHHAGFSGLSGVNLPILLSEFALIFPTASAWLPSSGLSLLVLLFVSPLCAVWTIILAMRQHETRLSSFLSGFFIFYFFSYLMVRASDSFFAQVTFGGVLVFILCIILIFPQLASLYAKIVKGAVVGSGLVVSGRYKLLVGGVCLILLVPFFLPSGQQSELNSTSDLAEVPDAALADDTQRAVVNEDGSAGQPGLDLEEQAGPANGTRADLGAAGSGLESSPSASLNVLAEEAENPAPGVSVVQKTENTSPLPNGSGPGNMTDIDPLEPDRATSTLQYRGMGNVIFTIDTIKATIGRIRKAVPRYRQEKSASVDMKEALIIEVQLENISANSVLILRNIWDNVYLTDESGRQYSEYSMLYPENCGLFLVKVCSMTLNPRSKVNDTMIFQLPDPLKGHMWIKGDPGYYQSTDSGIREISQQPFAFEFSAEHVR